MSPIPIEANRWWFMGCFIQQQDHLESKPFIVLEDTEDLKVVGSCNTMPEAEELARRNKVDNYLYRLKSFV